MGRLPNKHFCNAKIASVATLALLAKYATLETVQNLLKVQKQTATEQFLRRCL
ncbi:hypothetical protein OBV_32290 [Oscillibacter valericigenes Sjm18-20]|nr:hypothetical protein OBV_32290 [Oscillibacter valericigenes Sjm18-20]